MSSTGGGKTAGPVASQPGKAPATEEAAENRPYNLRPKKKVDKAAPGEGVEALSGAAGKAGASARTTFRAVDVKPAESDEEYSDAVEVGSEHEDSDLDRYELRSIASASDPLETEPPRRDGDIEEGPSEDEGRTSRQRPIPSPRASREDGGADRRSHRHSPPSSFEEMTWAEFEAYRRIHQEFQRRALDERASFAPRPDEPLTCGDLPSEGREAPRDKEGRREPRTSRSFGYNFTASRREPGGRSPAGEFSDIATRQWPC